MRQRAIRDRRAGSLALALLLASAAAAPAQQPAPEADPEIAYFVVDQRVVDVLAMIERDTGLRIQPTEAVRGRVRRMRLVGPVGASLAALGARHDLDVFRFGDTVHVSTKAEATMRLVRLDGIGRGRALGALEQAGLAFAPGDVRDAADGTALALSGPPRMLAIAEAIVESVPPLPPVPRPPARTVKVRRGTEVALEPVALLTGDGR